MRAALVICAGSVAIGTFLTACGAAAPPPAGDRKASPAGLASEQRPLAETDITMFLAVRSKALQRLEDALADVEANGGDVLTRVQEVTVAERDAARALGVEWRRFTWVRDQVGRLMTGQRQHEDQRLLAAELTKAREDLGAQLAAARDAASRQFLEAQLKVVTDQLEKLNRERAVPAPRAEELRVLESARAEIAILQGRQDRIQHRVQELLQRAAHVAPSQGASPVPAR